MAEFSGHMYIASSPLPIYTRSRRRSSHQQTQERLPSRPLHRSTSDESLQSTSAPQRNQALHSRNSSHSGSQLARSPSERERATRINGLERSHTTSTTSPLRYPPSVNKSTHLARQSSAGPTIRGYQQRHHGRQVLGSRLNNANEKDPAMTVSSSRAPTEESLTRVDSASSRSQTTLRSGDHALNLSQGNISGPLPKRPFISRNQRQYLNDPNFAYPLPFDLAELHRQSLKTLLLMQVLGGPVCCPSLLQKPPMRVLELGCGSGFWSMMCHRFFKAKGYPNISFVGIDIVPMDHEPSASIRPDPDMKWKYVQHDLTQYPWPFQDDSFDLIFGKDISLVGPNFAYTQFSDEFGRLLTPGGTLEFWETDSAIRMLRPHVPNFSKGEQNSAEAEEQETLSRLGTYTINAGTPLSPPLNNFLVEYNQWVQKAFESRNLTAIPCSEVGPFLLQETEILEEVRSLRLALPLSEVRWEREGVGGVVTKDGKSYVETKNKAPHHTVEKRTLTNAQAALRSTALQLVVDYIQALEPVLREVSGKNSDEWDLWLGKMMADLMSDGGTSWGECLEIGAWWCKRKMPQSKKE